MRDPPSRSLLPRFDCRAPLYPSDDGYLNIGEGIDLGLVGR